MHVSVLGREKQAEAIAGAHTEREGPGNGCLPLHGHVLARIAGQVPWSVVTGWTVSQHEFCPFGQISCGFGQGQKSCRFL